MPKNKEYTVLLRRPDYVTTDPDDQMYLDHVKTPTPKLAAFLAKRRASNADSIAGMIDDYVVVFLCEGHVKDLSFKVNQ